MAYNIYEKVNNIFSDELIDNKKLIFSPMKPFSKFSKKFQDNHFSLNLIEKSMDTSADKNKSPKHKKKQMKIIKENSKPIITQNSNRKLKSINNNHPKTSSKDILSTIKSIIKSNKEKEDKKDNDITDSGYPLNDKESKRTRGKSSYNHNHLTSSPYMKAIHAKERDSKRIKISRFELDDDKNEKIEEEEEHKLNEDDKETIKEKNKKTNKAKDKINDKSFSIHKFKKNRGSINETNENLKKERNNKSIINESLNSEKDNQSPKSKGKKKRNYITKSAKDIQTTKAKKVKEKIKKHYSDKKKIELLTPPTETKPNDKDISSYNSSNLSGESNSLSNKKKEEKKENKKTNNIKTNNNVNVPKNNTNNNNNNISDESNFHSSIFSNDSNDNEEEIVKKKIAPKSYKSSKCIKFFANKELNNFKIKKFTNKKSQDYYNKSKDYKNIQEKDEESKGSSESTKKNDDKGKKKKKINEKISSSEVKNLRRGNSKRKLYIPSPSQYRITPRVNNILILPDKDNQNNNENKDKDINQNMNIISPGNFISIEYNIDHGKKNERDLEIKNNNIIINNNESNNITCYRKDIRNKNEIKERINEDDNIINENNNGYNEYINSKNNIIKGKKKPRKRFCFCCL